MKLLLLVAVLVAGCSEDKAKPAEANSSLGDKLASAGRKVRDTATTVGEDVAGKAKDLSDQAKGLGSSVVDRTTGVAGDVAGKATSLSKEALATGKRVKAELDKVHRSSFDYDLSVDATPEAAAAHERRLATMPNVVVGTTNVGYEQDSDVSILGTKYRRHFRATWRAGDGRTVRLSLFTQEELDLVAFANLLQKIVPLATKVI
ncbi:MAG: hypothetical protein WKG01_08315 [Kofleriaceae bacterium]